MRVRAERANFHLIPSAEAGDEIRVSTAEHAGKDEKSQMMEIMAILNYNQGLVEFADSKAGSLILLNSLLIAAAGALPSTGPEVPFKFLSLVVCSIAVFLCFQVICSKEKTPFCAQSKRNAWEANDFVFFASLAKHKTGSDFVKAFSSSNSEDRSESLLHRSFVVAGIAQRKFSQYKVAQQATLGAMALWVVMNLAPLIKF